MRTVITIVLAVLVLAGCATTRGDTPGEAPSSDAPEASATSEPGPSATPSPTTSASAGALAAELTITLDETGSGTTRTTTLTCGPAGGDHPDPAAACTALAAVGAEAFAAPPQDQACTQQYGGPQVATVEGTVAGAPVSARFSRTDGCEISRWDALAPVLGSTGGV